MGTRMERRKQLKAQRRKKFCKGIILLSTLLILYFGIKVVNETIIYLGYMENPTIFSLNIRKKELNLFGKNYFIDLNILKKNY
ncbi:MAG: hypothetical protein GXY88_01655 [Tissierellia bacterium]|nr:hypothetical protein [Tissierellia bacterium]